MGQAATFPCRRGGTYATELYEWFRKFLNECPSGLITLHEFRRHFCDGTVGMESAEYAEQIFRTIDNNERVIETLWTCLDHWQAVYKMSVAASLTEPNPLTAEECTNRIFIQLDKDNNAIITLEEFIEGAMDDDWIRQMLACDPNTIVLQS
ncbi:guanylyl cyclase inhibitory protein-like [Clarias magur]|uniref:Guanylyl cyclase inhibitory protein-like n=1 Tax=Clarias magur TaxID=1594786 RepID=A0A8J4UL95_CLAMG|nr:guanylyl cyclase inhibitory protein-like [Clarias magur]